MARYICFVIYWTILSVLSLAISVASDFDKVAGTATYYLQYYYMWYLRIIGKVAGGSHGSNHRYRRPPPLVDNTHYDNIYFSTFMGKSPITGIDNAINWTIIDTSVWQFSQSHINNAS